MEWSFRYAGPLEKTDDRDCPVCTAVATKRCRAHGEQDDGCARCAAARSGECLAHAGLASALAAHAAILHLTDHGAARWKRVKPQDPRPDDGAERVVQGGDVGRRQERLPTQSPAADPRAAMQYDAAARFAQALFAGAPEGAEVEVAMRGDADVPGNCPMTVTVEARLV